MKKTNNKLGFTLIEIMIVIVIISLLAVTLVPKLTWAQARSRDASRVSSLLSMKAVLTVYYDDYWEFPVNAHDETKNGAAGGAADWDGCLSSDAKWNTDTLSDYVEWWKTSFDPQKNALVLWCATAGSFWYTALMKNWSDNSAFILSAQTETYQKSNTITVSALTDTENNWEYDINDLDWTNYLFEQEIWDLKTIDEESATKTIYTVTWG